MRNVGMWWGTWHGYIELCTGDISQIWDGPGVYIIAAFSSIQSEKPIIISRLLNEDRFGILCIGKSYNLRKRLQEFRRSIYEGSQSHSAGWRYNFIDELQRWKKESRKIKNKYPPNGLKIAYLISDSNNDAEEDESGALRHYLLKYGELPPLNNQFNWAKWK